MYIYIYIYIGLTLTLNQSRYSRALISQNMYLLDFKGPAESAGLSPVRVNNVVPRYDFLRLRQYGSAVGDRLVAVHGQVVPSLSRSPLLGQLVGRSRTSSVQRSTNGARVYHAGVTMSGAD